MSAADHRNGGNILKLESYFHRSALYGKDIKGARGPQAVEPFHKWKPLSKGPRLALDPRNNHLECKGPLAPTLFPGIGMQLEAPRAEGAMT